MEKYMVVITRAGRKSLETLLADNRKQSLRIYLASAKCSDPRLGIEIKKPYPSDRVFECQGLIFAADPVLLLRAQTIVVDCVEGELRVTPAAKYALSNCALCGGCRKQEGYT